MQYHLLINQQKSIEWGLDLKLAGLFAFLYEVPSWATSVNVLGQTWYWISRKKILDEMPVLGVTNNSVYRYMKELEKRGLIVLGKDKSIGMTLIQLTDKASEWNRNSSISNNEEPIAKLQKPPIAELQKPYCKNADVSYNHISTNQEDHKEHMSSDDDQLVRQKDQNQKHNCPHELILDAWKKVMPDKTQHNRSTWQGSVGAANLAARWKECFKIKREAGARKGQLLYETYEEGVKWWEQFFTFLRNSNFLMGNTDPMPGHKRFALTLKWVVKKENFINILEYKYHDKPSERAPVAPQPEFRNGI